MVSLETIKPNSNSVEPTSSPRISFSADFLDERNFITISPNSQVEKKENSNASEREKLRTAEFEFLSCNLIGEDTITADELFCEGKLLPFWQMHHSEKLNKISLKTEQAQEGTDEGREGNKNNNSKNNKNKKKEEMEEPRMSWFLDDDPSPRPPKCTVLWKELLRLKKQRASSLSPSSSTSSSSSSSLGEVSSTEESKDGAGNRDKHVKRIKKGLERTRSASLRIRPMVNVPICTHGKHNALPPLFSLKKGRLER